MYRSYRLHSTVYRFFFFIPATSCNTQPCAWPVHSNWLNQFKQRVIWWNKISEDTVSSAWGFSNFFSTLKGVTQFHVMFKDSFPLMICNYSVFFPIFFDLFFNKLLGLLACQREIRVEMVTRSAAVTLSGNVKTGGGTLGTEGIFQNKNERESFLNAGYMRLNNDQLNGSWNSLEVLLWMASWQSFPVTFQ